MNRVRAILSSSRQSKSLKSSLLACETLSIGTTAQPLECWELAKKKPIIRDIVGEHSSSKCAVFLKEAD